MKTGRLLLAVVLPALLLGILFPAVSGAARPLETGVTTPDLLPADELAYERIKGAGAGMTRVIIDWAAVAPAAEPEAWDPTDPNEPNYNWTKFDRAIQLATDAGLTVLASVYRAPAWAERCKTEIPGICDPDPDMFADFTEAAAQRYNGSGDQPRVRYWKAWNEPNLFLFFMPQFNQGKKVSPILYRAMLNKFATRVRLRIRRTWSSAGGWRRSSVPADSGRWTS